jgi:hypothetical protein
MFPQVVIVEDRSTELTVTVVVPAAVWKLARMLAEPAAIAVSKPVADTRATLLSDDVQVAPDATFCPEARTAVSWDV